MVLPPEPFGLSLGELRRLAQERDGRLPRAFVEALATDARAGARALARGLDSRRRARRRERERQGRLLRFESELWGRGIERVAGVDEAGMGPLAGPVVAAAAILAPGQRFEGLDDSKKLERERREHLASRVRDEAVGVAVGLASVEEIAELDIHRAGLLAMRRAVEALRPRPQHLLVDARTVPGVAVPQDGHVRGDSRSLSIAAASVVAKTHRDAIMAELDARFPGYGFARHQGYGTSDHLAALRRLGPCAAHRSSWEAVAEHAGRWSASYYRLRDALGRVRDAAGLEDWRREASRLCAGLEPRELRRLERQASRAEAMLRPPQRERSGSLPLG